MDECILTAMHKHGELVLGSYRQQVGKATYSPKVEKEWKFDIPTEGFHYLGTIVQDAQKSIVFEDGNKDECDAYVKTINPDFDPKAAIVLKPKRYINGK